MLDVSRPGNAITIDGQLLRSVPLTSRRIWSDAIDMTPGVNSRTVDTGGGQMVYYARGAEVYNHSFSVEGAPASAFADGAATGLSLSGDTIADVEIKLGAVDASSPSTTGVVVNIVTPRGGNHLKGSAASPSSHSTGTTTTPRRARAAACQRSSRSSSSTSRSAAQS